MNNSPTLTTSQRIAHEMVRVLFSDDPKPSFRWSETLRLFVATCIWSDPQLLQDFRTELANKFNSQDAGDKDAYAALSYSVFAKPEDGAQYTIQGKEYTMRRVLLSSGWLRSPAYAYLFEPTELSERTILVFKGTTFPSDDGFLAGLAADTKPGAAIGHPLYNGAATELQQLIQDKYSASGKRVLCVGHSLGGALALLAHVHQPALVDVHAISPPSLTTVEQQIYQQAEAEEQTDDELGEVKVFLHPHDLVPHLGGGCLPGNSTIFMARDAKATVFAHATIADNYDEVTDTDKKQQLLKPSQAWRVLKTPAHIGVLLLHLPGILPHFVLHLFKEINALPPGEKLLCYVILAFTAAAILVATFGTIFGGPVLAPLSLTIALSYTAAALFRASLLCMRPEKDSAQQPSTDATVGSMKP